MALTRVPTFAGPIWPSSRGRFSARFAGSIASLPSGLNSGTTTSVSVLDQLRRAGRRAGRAASIRLASLPSTSPAWMPLITSTTGMPRARDSAGVRTPCADMTTSGSSRPCGLVPKRRQVEPRIAAAVERREEPHHVGVQRRFTIRGGFGVRLHAHLLSRRARADHAGARSAEAGAQHAWVPLRDPRGQRDARDRPVGDVAPRRTRGTRSDRATMSVDERDDLAVVLGGARPGAAPSAPRSRRRRRGTASAARRRSRGRAGTRPSNRNQPGLRGHRPRVAMAAPGDARSGSTGTRRSRRTAAPRVQRAGRADRGASGAAACPSRACRPSS